MSKCTTLKGFFLHKNMRISCLLKHNSFDIYYKLSAHDDTDTQRQGTGFEEKNTITCPVPLVPVCLCVSETRQFWMKSSTLYFESRDIQQMPLKFSTSTAIPDVWHVHTRTPDIRKLDKHTHKWRNPSTRKITSTEFSAFWATIQRISVNCIQLSVLYLSGLSL